MLLAIISKVAAAPLLILGEGGETFFVERNENKEIVEIFGSHICFDVSWEGRDEGRGAVISSVSQVFIAGGQPV